ncbi:hypothetical protein COU37_04050 [Candidatus Micrarchaeota archaeon CG10_big_fil_rev_8_21_14_0_10_45_29]|nr:MAG: hypothetical protein COU37_04050 [Candidatus Micrarchaeota archaeon CG10_big_fil_rev_8_21_14_0_10_45_29]
MIRMHLNENYNPHSKMNGNRRRNGYFEEQMPIASNVFARLFSAKEILARANGTTEKVMQIMGNKGIEGRKFLMVLDSAGEHGKNELVMFAECEINQEKKALYLSRQTHFVGKDEGKRQEYKQAMHLQITELMNENGLMFLEYVN